jgi:hypothetical protein
VHVQLGLRDARDERPEVVFGHAQTVVPRE